MTGVSSHCESLGEEINLINIDNLIGRADIDDGSQNDNTNT